MVVRSWHCSASRPHTVLRSCIQPCPTQPRPHSCHTSSTPPPYSKPSALLSSQIQSCDPMCAVWLQGYRTESCARRCKAAARRGGQDSALATHAVRRQCTPRRGQLHSWSAQSHLHGVGWMRIMGCATVRWVCVCASLHALTWIQGIMTEGMGQHT